MQGELVTEGYLERCIEECERKLAELPGFSLKKLEWKLAMDYYEWKLRRIREAAEE